MQGIVDAAMTVTIAPTSELGARTRSGLAMDRTSDAEFRFTSNVFVRLLPALARGLAPGRWRRSLNSCGMAPICAILELMSFRLVFDFTSAVQIDMRQSKASRLKKQPEIFQPIGGAKPAYHQYLSTSYRIFSPPTRLHCHNQERRERKSRQKRSVLLQLSRFGRLCTLAGEFDVVCKHASARRMPLPTGAS